MKSNKESVIMNHNTTKYETPEQEPQMVSEPIAAYVVPQQHQAMYYNMHEIKPEIKSEDSVEKLEIPETYEEALSMGAMDLEDARKELHAYVDKLAKEYDLR